MEKQDDPALVLAVVVPAYNEQERLPLTLERIYHYLLGQSFRFELIVVDDGSNDRTAEVAEQFLIQKNIGRLLKNPVNLGKGFSVRRGVLHAGAEYVLFSDADLSTPIEEVGKLLPPLLDRRCDIAIASRAQRQSDIRLSQPWYRTWMGRFFNLLVRALAVPGIKDTQCGFKCFTREAAQRVFTLQRLTRFGFDVEVLYLAQKAGYVIREVPVVWINSPDSRVHVVTDSVQMFLDLWRIRLNDWMGHYGDTSSRRASLQHSPRTSGPGPGQ